MYCSVTSGRCNQAVHSPIRSSLHNPGGRIYTILLTVTDLIYKGYLFCSPESRLVVRSVTLGGMLSAC
jgi:hypothetical protein